jgi:hypothetical protein
MVALCNFGSKCWELLQRVVVFLSKSLKKLLYKLSGTSELLSKMSGAFDAVMMLSPNSKNGSTWINKVYLGLRIAAGLVLVVAVALKTKLRQDIEKEHHEIVKEFEDIQLEEKEIMEK